MRAKILILAVLTFSIVSCSKDRVRLRPPALDRVIEARSVIAVINDLILDTDNISKGPIVNPKFGGSYRITENRTTKKIEFDFKKKQGRRIGNIEGKMTLIYEFTPNGPRRLERIKTKFDELIVNDVKVKGNETIEVDGVGRAFTFNITADAKITWKDNSTALYHGTKTVKRFKGARVNEDIIEIVGKQNVKLRDGKEYILEVISPLKRKPNFRHFTQGELKIQYNKEGGILDYGDGQADNIAVFTGDDGKEETIRLW